MLLSLAAIVLLRPAMLQAASGSDALLDLAEKAVEAAASGRPSPKVVAKAKPRPVFVTIERGGKVLGCRGSLRVRTSSLEEEVVQAATAAALHDPRHARLRSKDIRGSRVTVTVVNELQPLTSVEDLAQSDGLVLMSGEKVGVVLPWEGRDPRIRLEWAYRKAGISQGSAAILYLMKAERYAR